MLCFTVQSVLLCWQLFHADFRETCILLLLDRLFCKHQLDEVEWYCHLYGHLYLCWFSVCTFTDFLPTYQLLTKRHSVQFNSVTQSSPTLCDTMDCSMPGLSVHQQLPEFTQTHLHWVSDTIQPSHPLLSPSPSTFNLSQHQDLFKDLRIRWPKYWSFSLSISPSNEHPGLISFRMDCLDPLAVQGTLKSLLQHHSSKASILRHSAFFVILLSHPYMILEKS